MNLHPQTKKKYRNVCNQSMTKYSNGVIWLKYNFISLYSSLLSRMEQSKILFQTGFEVCEVRAFQFELFTS